MSILSETMKYLKNRKEYSTTKNTKYNPFPSDKSEYAVRAKSTKKDGFVNLITQLTEITLESGEYYPLY